MQQGRIVISGSTAPTVIDNKMMRTIRGPLWGKPDGCFFIVIITSLIFYSLFILKISTMKLKEEQVLVIEKIPDRFAKLIIDKPIQKKASDQNPIDKLKTKVDDTKKQEKELVKTPLQKKQIAQKAAQKAVASRAARIEKKVRTVGVLGMLTGVGTTAKGPSVADVLGSVKNKKDHFQDLEKALKNMTGLKATNTKNIMTRKLIQSKDVSISHKENIDDLVASIGTATTATLAKKGNFVIQKPESIEGAASSNMKRDDHAINKIVSSNKVSIRMSYEKYLKRIPDLEGKITIRFTISAAGKVTDIQILENTTNNKELEQDIIRKIKMWRFDSITEGKVTVTYPFIFKPS